MVRKKTVTEKENTMSQKSAAKRSAAKTKSVKNTTKKNLAKKTNAKKIKNLPPTPPVMVGVGGCIKKIQSSTHFCLNFPNVPSVMALRI